MLGRFFYTIFVAIIDIATAMSYITTQKVGKHTYLIECTGYRNEEKKSRNKRRYVGRIDPKTGQKIYKTWYIEECKENGIMLSNPTDTPEFSVDDVLKSDIRSYGLFYFMTNIAERIKLLEALQNSFKDVWREYFMLSTYMIATNDPFMYCRDWIEDTECYEVRSALSSQYISRLLTNQDSKARNDFYSQWYSERQCDEYIAIDITSESSYSDIIDYVEYGYNRDGESLPQVNHCMLIGEKERLPVMQSIFSGSIRDVSTLKLMIEEIKTLLGATIEAKTILSDKGFYSKENIDALLGEGMNFLIAMPFISNLSYNILDMVRDDIEDPNNAITINGITMMGTCKEIQWDENHTIYAEIFYNPIKAANAKTELYSKCTDMKRIIMDNPKPYYDMLLNESIRAKMKKCKDSQEKKILESQLRHVDPNEIKFKISEVRSLFKIEEIVEGEDYKVITDKTLTDEKLKSSGWLIILSSQKKEPSEVLSAYRDKDVVEKVFWRTKNSIDLNRLRVHGNDAMQAKMFIGFIASILMCYMNNIMSEKGLYKKYTMYEMVKKLQGLRVQQIKGRKLLFPCTNEQREIFDVFEIDYPDKNGVAIS